MLKQRVITAVVLVLILAAVLFGLSLAGFAIFTAVMFSLAAWEWANLAGYEASWQRLLVAAGYAAGAALLALASGVFANVGADGGMHTWVVAVVALLAGLFWLQSIYWVATYPASAARWSPRQRRLLAGALVLWPAWLAIVYLRSLPQGIVLFIYIAALVSAADIGAYFAGRQFGKRKLAPRVSPGKSWAGFVGGLASTTVLALVVGWLGIIPSMTPSALLIATVIASIASVYGDLVESMIKRERGIKDSSNLLPGHGGVLDRVDSVTAAAPVFTLFLILLQG
jgi:phosphatidate cytidylyltransferase